MFLPPTTITNVTQSATHFIVSSSTVLVDSAAECNTLGHCRTIWDIIWSCLITISICIWVAVHPNIPQIKPQREHWWEGLIDKAKAFVNRVAVALLALLAPEFIFVWALRQLLSARIIAKRCQKAADGATQKHRYAEEERKRRSKEHEQRPSEKSGHEADTAPDPVIEDWEVYKRIYSNFWVRNGVKKENLVPQRWAMSKIVQTSRGQPDRSESYLPVWDQFAHNLRPEWTTTHGFFILMGGFHQFDGDTPLVYLTPYNVADLIDNGLLIPPSEDEIRDRSKSDSFAKALVIVQTLWFVMQAIARHIERLPITELEIATLAYTIPILGIYICWWDKPLGVSQPIQVQKSIWDGADDAKPQSSLDSFVTSLTGMFS